MINVLALAAIFSGIGMAVIFARRLSEARAIGEDEFMRRLASAEPIFSDFKKFVLAPAGRIWRTKFMPVFYRKRAGMISRFRKIVVKASAALLKFDDYLHGKSGMKPGAGSGSGYWSDINKFKNEIKQRGEPGEE